MPDKTMPEVVELDAQELEAKLDQIEQVMGEETVRPFRMLLTWYLKLLSIIQRKNTSIKRLRQLLFGKKTERLSDLLDPPPTPDDEPQPGVPDASPETSPPESRPAAEGD